ncbi:MULTISPECIES: hypothetical protein [Klebsiella]|jgi:hypothetical protein|nr:MULTISPECIES: hypothetical protein [Klebsiella]DAU47720.1 MAG TPA: hypothetical protein [Caudoviricetes sp.]HEN4847149.1 hypothetical protein [Klebsiella quasipneumoniae subsp. similipneumoniae]MCE7490148.1 hypothetical protein [Klebsiella pneumoniae]MCE7501109.1 hypothetical protein [Klebsiella pneumoniae]MCF8597782.1 hypothetical protein [Klebsiella sp. 2019SCSN059]
MADGIILEILTVILVLWALATGDAMEIVTSTEFFLIHIKTTIRFKQ